MYNYKARVTNVVDGDTIDVLIDLGFFVTVSHRIRVASYDAPESTWRAKTEEERQLGLDAKKVATGLLLDHDITVLTHKDREDIYARYSADITMSDGRDFATVMKELGFIKPSIA